MSAHSSSSASGSGTASSPPCIDSLIKHYRVHPQYVPHDTAFRVEHPRLRFQHPHDGAGRASVGCGATVGTCARDETCFIGLRVNRWNIRMIKGHFLSDRRSGPSRKDFWFSAFFAALNRVSVDDAMKEADDALTKCDLRWKEQDVIVEFQYRDAYPVGHVFNEQKPQE